MPSRAVVHTPSLEKVIKKREGDITSDPKMMFGKQCHPHQPKIKSET